MSTLKCTVVSPDLPSSHDVYTVAVCFLQGLEAVVETTNGVNLEGILHSFGNEVRQTHSWIGLTMMDTQGGEFFTCQSINQSIVNVSAIGSSYPVWCVHHGVTGRRATRRPGLVEICVFG